MTRTLRTLAAAVACLALLWAACPAPGAAQEAKAQGPLEQTGNMAVLGSMDLVRLVAGARGKVVVFSFWASWCAPCRAEIPELNELRRAFSEDDLLVVGLSVDEDPLAYSKFVTEAELGYPVRRVALAASRMYHVGTIPRLVVYGPGGSQAVSHEGPVGAEELISLVKRLLTEKAG